MSGRKRRTGAWWKEYREHLKSPEWDAIRKQAMSRDGHLCQDCGRQVATEVHHLSYDNVGEESPEELVSLCSECHRNRHPERVRTTRRVFDEEVMP